MKKEKKLVVPKFKSESEEAAWWFDNRALVEEALINAMDRKTIRRAPSRNITIPMQEADLAWPAVKPSGAGFRTRRISSRCCTKL